MNIKTAVIPVGGAGSGLLPLTAAIEKCMMPIYAGHDPRVLVDYALEECALAGLERVVLVATERGQRQLIDHLGLDLPDTLNKQLERVGKDDKIEEEKHRRRYRHGLKIEFIVQELDDYGNAIPLALALEDERLNLMAEEHIAFLGGDDFIYRQDDRSMLAEAIAEWEAKGTDHAIIGMHVKREDAVKYGNLQLDEDGNLQAFYEKPPLEGVAEEPMVNISRILLNTRRFAGHVRAEMERELKVDENGKKDERSMKLPLQNALAEGQSFHVFGAEGEYLDGGTVPGLLAASIYVNEHPRHRPFMRLGRPVRVRTPDPAPLSLKHKLQ